MERNHMQVLLDKLTVGGRRARYVRMMEASYKKYEIYTRDELNFLYIRAAAIRNRSKFTYPILLLVILSVGLCIAYEISKFALKAVANYEGFKKMIDTEINYSEYLTLCINAWTAVTMIDILFMAMFIFMIRSNFFDIEREYLTLKYIVEKEMIFDNEKITLLYRAIFSLFFYIIEIGIIFCVNNTLRKILFTV
ncbi:hypothetical protein P9705_001258 [Enterococcus faecalis]|nr:hypothetical protein [Enterococcus faecalis]